MTSMAGTPSRPGWRAALLATLAVAALPAAASDTRASCPLLGAVYAAGPHRLTMEPLPDGALGSAVYTLWRFRAHAPGGAALGELRMLYVCPNGRANCSISPSARPGPRGGYFSEAIGLNRDLSLTTGEDTPYAFVLPGFATIRWEGAARELAADVTYAGRARTAPDFDNRVVWRRLRCGPPEAVR